MKMSNNGESHFTQRTTAQQSNRQRPVVIVVPVTSHGRQCRASPMPPNICVVQKTGTIKNL